eukprot:CAMPEP_0117427042 /NCGR_PEP_ID=MMETSP0758-20121206/6993_1 /TAXON_ID=63605 /ORGANISM="Percolomonas cosmopolitus, Strain AE-1 (ATCC 50343)" /LENGTH=141 /DNA_ID=CAMNT_0005212489 /DNA_START=555 /DNA_END=980 /DNA_ORIENTATION=-
MTHTLLYYYYMMGSCDGGNNFIFAFNALSRLMPTILSELNLSMELTDESIEMHLIPMILGDSIHTASIELLHALLSIVQSQGCFKDENPSIEQVLNPNMSMRYGVKVLLDYPSGDACSYHTTGIGFAILANYLQILINGRV